MSAESFLFSTRHFYSGFLCLWALLTLRVSPAKTLGVFLTRRFALTQFYPAPKAFRLQREEPPPGMRAFA